MWSAGHWTNFRPSSGKLKRFTGDIGRAFVHGGALNRATSLPCEDSRMNRVVASISSLFVATSVCPDRSPMARDHHLQLEGGTSREELS